MNKAMPSAVGELEDCTAVVSLRSQGPVRCPCVEVWGMQLHSAASQCGGRWLQVREIKTSYASDNVNVRSATGLTSMQTRSDTHIVYRLTRKVGEEKSPQITLPMVHHSSRNLCVLCFLCHLDIAADSVMHSITQVRSSLVQTVHPNLECGINPWLSISTLSLPHLVCGQ